MVLFYFFYDFAPEPRKELGIGIFVPVPNDVIDFGSAHGALLLNTRGLGPVPIRKTGRRHPWEREACAGVEAFRWGASDFHRHGQATASKAPALAVRYRPECLAAAGTAPAQALTHNLLRLLHIGSLRCCRTD